MVLPPLIYQRATQIARRVDRRTHKPPRKSATSRIDSPWTSCPTGCSSSRRLAWPRRRAHPRAAPRDPDHPHPISIDLVNGAVEREDVEVDLVYCAEDVAGCRARPVIRRVSRASPQGPAHAAGAARRADEGLSPCWRRATSCRPTRRSPSSARRSRRLSSQPRSGRRRPAAARGGGRRGGRRGGGRPGEPRLLLKRVAEQALRRAVVEIAHVHVRYECTAPASPTSARHAA